MIQYVEQDTWTLGIASSALLLGVILFFFRNLRWVLIPVLLIQVTLIWTKGMLAISGARLSMVSSILTSLVTIICIATLMHVTLVYRNFRTDFDAKLSLLKTFSRLKAPILWTIITTAVGFASLLSSSIVPVRSFAIMMTIATLLVPVIGFAILPGGVLIGGRGVDPGSPFGEKWVKRTLTLFAQWSNRFGLPILVTISTAGIITGIGLTKLTVETDFSKNFRSDSPIVHAIEFFESNMGGVGSWEVGFDAPSELSEEFLDQIRSLAEKLRKLKLEDGTQLTKVIAMTDGLDLVPRVRANDPGGRLFSLVPRFREPTLDERVEFLNELQPEMAPSLYRPDLNRMRILLRSLEQQPAETKLALIDKVEEVAKSTFPDANVQATGLYVLLSNLISSILSDQRISGILALCGITLTMTIAFRSIRVGLVSILPNLLPILFVVGTMGWLEVPVNIGTAMIVSVSLGLTVDSTIHYLFSYRRSRENGVSHGDAVIAAHGEVGLAVLLSTVALVLGFSVLTLSNFVPLADFGILVSVAMLGGLLCNLFLLPALLKITWTERRLELESSAETSTVA